MENLTSYVNAKIYNYNVGVKSELLKRFREINEHDRMQLFGFKKENEVFSNIREGTIDEETMDMILTWYEKEYISPFWSGDILKDQSDDSQWIVTCIYTDGSIDLISASGAIVRENTGTMKTDYIKIGTLNVTIEPEITLETLLK